LLRELVNVEEIDPEQKAWIEPMCTLLFMAKKAVSVAKESGNDQIKTRKKYSFLGAIWKDR
jgi:hypothetical protein